MSRRNKEALVIVLDISATEANRAKEKSVVADGKAIVDLILKQKLREQKKDEVCLLVLGASGNSSGTAADDDDDDDDDDEEEDDTGSGSALTCVHNFDVPSMEMYRKCLDDGVFQDPLSAEKVDSVEALHTAISKLKRRTGKRKYTRKILFFSDFSGEKLAEDSVDEETKEMLEEQEIELTLVVASLEEDSESKSRIESVQKVAEKLDGESESSRDFISALQGPQEPPVGATNKFTHGVMTIGSHHGDQVELRVQVFSKSDSTGNRLKTLTRLAKSPTRAGADAYAPVEREHRHESSGKDTIGVEVVKEDIVSGFYYGKELIVVDQANAEALGYFPSPCLQILGFARKDFVSIAHCISPVDLVMANPKAPQSVLGFQALVHAMKEEKQIALARYVGRRNATAAKLVRLVPSISGKLACMYMVQIACAEEVRHFDFRSLEKHNPTKEQVGAMEDLIKQFKVKDFAPETVSDPVYRRFYDEVHARALDPSHEFKPLAKPPLEPDPELVKQGGEILDTIRKLFPLETVQVAGKKRDYWGMESGQSSAKEPEEKVKLEGQDTDLADWLQKQKTKATSVGQANPVADFESMLVDADDTLATKAIEEIIDRIEAFVGPAGGEDYFEKAVACVLALRKGCIQKKKSDRFNTFLKKLKGESGGKEGFWESQLLPKEVTLITDQEADDSLCSAQEAKAFLQEATQDEPEEKIEEEKEEEASDMSDFD